MADSVARCVEFKELRRNCIKNDEKREYEKILQSCIFIEDLHLLGCVCFVGREGRKKEAASGEGLSCLDRRGRGGMSLELV